MNFSSQSGLRIKEERKRLGLSQEMAGKACGVSREMWGKYERGQAVMGTKVLEMFSEIGADAGYVLSGKRASQVHRAEEQPAHVLHDLVMVPRYDIQASAGNGVVIHSELIVDHLAFKQAWVRERGLNPKRLALIEVRGDSMEPTLRNHDLVLIDMASNTVGADGIYAIQLNGFLMTKRIQALMNGSIAVISDNATYRQQILQAEELESLHIIGEVVWFGREM